MGDGPTSIAEIDTPSFDDQSLSLVGDAVERATVAMADRLDDELRGAWRAGYEYVHVFDPIGTGVGPEETFTIRQYIHPSHRERPPEPEGVRYRYTYDLTAVSDAEIRAALRDA